MEAGLDVLSALAPEAAADLGGEVFALALWPEAKDRAAYALSRSAREASFERLLDAVGQTPRAGFLLGESPYPGGGERVLARLQASPVVRHEALQIPTHAAWQALSEKDRKELDERADKAAAVYPFADVSVASSLMEYLGKKRFAAALPLIEQLYAEHPSKKLRLAAGHALVALGDRSGLDLLTALGDSGDDWRQWFAVKSTIVQDPASAVERLGGETLQRDEGRERVGRAFEILNLDADAKAKSGGEPLVLADRRWLDVAARWVRDRGPLGEAADRVLRRFPAEDVKQAMVAGAAAAKPKKPAGSKREAASGAPAAAEKGHGIDVWRGLLALGAGVREPRHVDAARVVARATMLAARDDLARIVERLGRSGYRFLEPARVLVPPPADVLERLDELEAIAGRLPLSLRAAYEILGAYDLRGDHPEWPRSANVRLRPAASDLEMWLTDPLVLKPLAGALEEARAWRGQLNPFSLGFAGDPLTKAGYSGGVYGVTVPCLDADAIIEGEAKGRTFVEHLRTALANGGFAGFESMPDRPRALIDLLTT